LPYLGWPADDGGKVLGIEIGAALDAMRAARNGLRGCNGGRGCERSGACDEQLAIQSIISLA
jgi:hypothetical protein